MSNRNSSYAVTARQYEIRSEHQNEIMNTRMPTTMEKFSKNERRAADKQMQRNTTTNEKQVHRAYYTRANTDMQEKAVCDDQGGLALMEILDYA